MAYKFSTEDKVDMGEFQERIPFGVSEVVLVGAVSGQTEAGKDYLELTVADQNGLEDSARVWFTGGASPYSFQTIRQIVVHSASSDSDKEKARMAVEKCEDTDELAELLNKKCVGKQLWFTKYYDPTRTYQNNNGDVKRSINNSIYGYEPKLKPELMPEGQEPVKAEDFPLDEAGTAPSAAARIPDEWN